MTPTTDNTPDVRRSIRIPITYLLQGVILIVSLGVGYGGYRAGYENQNLEIQTAKQEINMLRQDLTDLRLELAQVKQSLDDVKDSLERQRH